METLVSFFIGVLTFISSLFGVDVPVSPVPVSHVNVATTSPQNVFSVKEENALYEEYRGKAKAMATSTLKKIIIDNVPVLMTGKEKGKMDEKLQLEVSAYLQEYTERGLIMTDKEINAMEGMFFEVFGACWGIKEGECRE